MTQAPAFSVVADVAITKGQTTAGDRAWLSFPDGTARRAVVHVIHDLPHLVVESAFGLEDGLWGTLARGGVPVPGRAPGRDRSLRLVTRVPLDDLAERTWPGHAVAKAAVDAVVNRWGDGPGTPDGVRDRLRGHSPEAADLADRLDDENILLAVAGVRRLCREWRALLPGGALRLTWPLHDGWLRAPVTARALR